MSEVPLSTPSLIKYPLERKNYPIKIALSTTKKLKLALPV